MIKFFRKIRQSLLSEGKTGKYFKYAIGEILLVIIGILIAVSINGWNEERKLKIEQQFILKDLKQEVTENQKALEIAIKGNEKSFQAAIAMCIRFSPKQSTQTDTPISLIVYQTYKLPPFSEYQLNF